MTRHCFYSVATGPYIQMFEMLKNSLRKFDKTSDFILFGENDIKQSNDNMILYRAAPYFAKKLFEQGYTEVCKLDADSIILGSLDHIWEGDYDVAVVNNSNPREMETYPVSVVDIHPLTYINAGFVVMKSEQFVNNWFKLCYSDHFNSFQMREQDLLNLIVFYFNNELGGPYKVKFLDQSNKWHGLISKQYTPNTKLIGSKIILPKDTEWPNDSDKELVAYQWAGGHQAPDKMKYKLIFPPEVSDYIETLIKP